MKIQLRSQYDNFTIGQPPKFIEWTREDAPIVCYVNEFVQGIDTPKEQSIALLIEPRSLYGAVYDWMEDNADRFKYIFTHDSQLLKKNNARKILFGGVYASHPEEKTKNISMISSTKQLCPLHVARLNLCRQLERKIDCYGFNGHRIDTVSAHGPYRFAIVIENYIDDYWFTEKICNCFANKCIPIYYGAKKITDFFNGDGIIEVQDLENVPLIVDALNDLFTGEEEYNKRLAAVEDNYNRVKAYYCFEDWFYNEYKALLEGMNDNNC